MKNVFEKTNFESSIANRIASLTESPVFLIVLLSILGGAIRFMGRRFISLDMTFYLRPWANEMISYGGLASLGHQVGDYNIPYQFILAIMTCLPIKIEYAIKLLSILFDYLLAIAAGMLVETCASKNTGTKRIDFAFVYGYALVMFIPSIIFNSSFWGQCDSIYAFFVVLSITYLLRGKYVRSFSLLGIAFAFKLQTVIVVPFFLFYYFSKDRTYSLIAFFISIFSFFAVSIPGYLSGRNFLAPIEIYTNQTTEYPFMSLNFLSFWNIAGTDYINLAHVAIALTAIILIIGFVLITKRTFNMSEWLLIACWTSWTVVLFLPSMHERYAYVPLILTCCTAFHYRKALPFALAGIIADLMTYGAYLFGVSYDQHSASIIMFVLYCIGTYMFFKKLRHAKSATQSCALN